MNNPLPHAIDCETCKPHRHDPVDDSCPLDEPQPVPGDVGIVYADEPLPCPFCGYHRGYHSEDCDR